MNRTLLLLLGISLGLAAQESAPGDSAQIKRRLSEVQARLGTVDQQLTALKKRRKGVLVEIQAITLEADRVRTQTEGARLKMEETHLQVTALNARKGVIHAEIQRRRGELRKQVRWMQAQGPLGELGSLGGISRFQDYLVQGRYQTYLRNQQRRRLDEIQHLRVELVKREGELNEALKRLGQEQQESSQLSANLTLSEERLRKFLEGLSQDESRQKEVQAELAEEAIQLERMLAQILAKPRSDAFEGPTAFASLRGELPQPTPGALSQAFGEHLHPLFHTRTMQSGLLIEAASGAPVVAVAEGKVVFVDIYQSFGPMVILDHGGGYFSIYNHLQGLAVSRGQILKQGEPLGAVGDTMDGPRLGFEIRHLTQPQDPNTWLKQRYRPAGGGGVSRKRR